MSPGAAAQATPDAVAPTTVPLPVPMARRRPRLAVDLTLLAVVFALLAAALAAAAATLYREFYSPSAFVVRYLSTLAEGSAADALALPGVALDAADLEAAGLPATASDALLRRAALATLTDVEVLSETTDGEVTDVTVGYKAGPFAGTTTFEVERNGSIGVAPAWRFATSPLAVVDLTVTGSMQFEVNGFEIDKRQVSPSGMDADPAAPVSLLVFSPGIYSVSVDTPISATPGVAVLSDSPMKATAVAVQAEPTDEFIDVVQERVEQFLTACAEQDVLLPTACPFGYEVTDRIASTPQWTIARQPAVTLEPNGAHWSIPSTEAVAHIEVDIRSLFDGSVHRASEDVPFLLTGTIMVQPNGSASITVTGTDTH